MSISRRTFATIAAAAAATAALPSKAFAIGRRRNADPIRIGVIGCGGRGTGAARNAVEASENVLITALGDLFPDRMADARRGFDKTATESARFAAAYKVTDDKVFTGWDAYEKVLATDCDLVILASPPAFRAMHLTAAVNAGKHIFAEKPVCVDVATAIQAYAAADLARQKGLGYVAGTQRRHDPRYADVIKRVHDGAIGEVITGQVYWNQGGLWSHARKPEWTDTEFHLRNWLYYTWASGDHIVEQHVHNLDVANWVMGAHPVKATAMGGRQTRTDAVYGHIFDHFAIEYEYADGRRITSFCRQQDGTTSRVREDFQGSLGRTNAADTIEGRNAYKAAVIPGMNPYVEEHRDLVASIRAGRPLNEGRQIVDSNLTAILGREAAYTGQTLTWDELMASNLSILPKEFAFGALAVPAVPTPGETTLTRSFSEGW
ncbi:MAG: Gfo/Idh/MocA family oxidoreductase [Gemmatimonadetes bacterium]|nr:Gfo/Idh/MocA family oxidoreductase [Gemmatimonadota bacterium]